MDENAATSPPEADFNRITGQAVSPLPEERSFLAKAIGIVLASLMFATLILLTMRYASRNSKKRLYAKARRLHLKADHHYRSGNVKKAEYLHGVADRYRQQGEGL